MNARYAAEGLKSRRRNNFTLRERTPPLVSGSERLLNRATRCYPSNGNEEVNLGRSQRYLSLADCDLTRENVRYLEKLGAL